MQGAFLFLHNPEPSVANLCNNFNNKFTIKLINENQVLSVEIFNIKDMMVNKLLTKMIADSSWEGFVIVI